jgi:hypothetical protein
MKVITCENVNKDKSGVEPRRCGRILAVLTDLQIDILRLDPEVRCIFRCPACHSSVRWSEVGYKDGKLTISPVENMPDLGEKIAYEEITFSGKA